MPTKIEQWTCKHCHGVWNTEDQAQECEDRHQVTLEIGWAQHAKGGKWPTRIYFKGHDPGEREVIYTPERDYR